MPDRHGVALWPGITSFISCTYTVSHGISPGTAILTCAPQGTPAERGDLVLQDGFSVVTIPDAKLERIDVTRDGSGIRWHLVIVDRRWRWRELGQISGWYNQPDPHGLLYDWTITPPSFLCNLCLTAMGESEFDIQVPDLQLPPVNWDYTTPAVALQQLADSLGCRVIYRLDTDTVLVCPVGQGSDLPDGSISSESPSLTTLERPDSIVLVGPPVRVQARFQLEAVGRDWDGFYRPLNDLSYVPKGAGLKDPQNPWRYVFGPGFQRFPATNRLTSEQAFDLARQSVYRCYRVVNVALDDIHKPLTLPGFDLPLQRREQLILQDTKVEQIQPAAPDEAVLDADGQKLIKHYYDGFRRDVPAECYGSYYLGSVGDLHAANKVENTRYDKKMSVGFSIDPVWQIITFDEFVLRLDKRRGGVEPVTVVLETGCLVRDGTNNQLVRYEREFVFGPPTYSTKPKYIIHDDCQFNIVGRYSVTVNGDNDSATHRLIGVQALGGQGFPVADLILRSDRYLLAEAIKYQVKGATQRTYNGLVAIPLDGKIQQVTWTVGEPDGAHTQASLNCEHSTYVPPYPQRLRIEYAPGLPPKVVPPLPQFVGPPKP